MRLRRQAAAREATDAQPGAALPDGSGHSWTLRNATDMASERATAWSSAGPTGARPPDRHAVHPRVRARSSPRQGGRRLQSSFEVALDLLTLCRIVLIRKSAGGLDLLTEAQVAERFFRVDRRSADSTRHTTSRNSWPRGCRTMTRTRPCSTRRSSRFGTSGNRIARPSASGRLRVDVATGTRV